MICPPLCEGLCVSEGGQGDVKLMMNTPLTPLSNTPVCRNTSPARTKFYAGGVCRHKANAIEGNVNLKIWSNDEC